MLKSRYAYLDGLRGIAAIFVLFLHTTTFWSYIFFHGYVAVDVFFLMSGYVIANAYDKRFKDKSLTVVEFIKIRLIRLYPMYFLSVIFALPLFFKIHYNHIHAHQSLELIFGVFITNIIMMPWRVAGSDHLYAFNIVYWSLLAEIIVNILYAVLYRFLTTRVILIGLFLVALSLSALTLWQNSLANGGPYWTPISLVMGLERALFGIFTGLLIYRHHDKLIKFLPILPGWVYLIVACMIMAAPECGKLNALFDLFAIFIAFPVVILGLTGTVPSVGNSILAALGATSYPLYLLHWPIFRYSQILFIYKEVKFAPFSGFLVLACLIMLCIYLERKVDEPIRRWVSLKLSKKNYRSASGVLE